MYAVRIVFPLEIDASDVQRKIAEEIATIRKQPAKVFRTHVVVGDHTYTLTTTSKDTHLEIGRISLDGQRNICTLLEQEFRESGEPEILLATDPSHRSMWVSKTMLSKTFSIYQLAPAY